MHLPPEDWARSPHTGWTCAHWERVADLLLEGVRPHASPSHALVHLPGAPSTSGAASDALEGYARTYLLAAFRLGGAGGTAPGDLADRYASGLEAGTDARHPEAWPRHEDGGQSLVEAAAIAIGLHETRPWIWDRLSSPVRERVVEWLSEATARRHWSSNWLLFPVVVSSFLKSVGADPLEDVVERNLDLVEKMYRGGGWYADGGTRSFDFYAAWGFHFYLSYWCRIEGDLIDPARAGVHRERLRAFLDDFRHLFAANGAPLHHGRSLTYRFGLLAPVWMGALLDASPLVPGETRRLASGTLRYFLERGALRNGILTRGWHGEFLPATQGSSGPASPYWASKAFVGLLLPPDHAVWTAPEEPLPVERDDFRRALNEPGFLVWGTQRDGIVRASTSESDHFPFSSSPLDNAHYRKLTYSTHTAPNTGPGDAADLDAQLTLTGGGAPDSRRRAFAALRMDDRCAASVSYPFEPGRLVPQRRRTGLERRLPVWLERRLPVLGTPAWRPALWLARQPPARLAGVRLERVETVSIPRGPAEIRLWHVASPFARVVRAGGLSVAAAEPPAVDVVGSRASAETSGGLRTTVVAVHGFDEAAVERFEGANAFGPHAAVPFLTATVPIRGAAIYVAVLVLSGEPVALEPLIPTAAVGRRHVRLSFPDGDEVCVDLPSRNH